MSSNPKSLRAFASSRETKKAEARPALDCSSSTQSSWLKLNQESHAKARSREEQGGIPYLPLYFGTAVAEAEVDLAETNRELVEIQARIHDATEKHNQFLIELGLPPLPLGRNR